MDLGDALTAVFDPIRADVGDDRTAVIPRVPPEPRQPPHVVMSACCICRGHRHARELALTIMTWVVVGTGILVCAGLLYGIAALVAAE